MGIINEVVLWAEYQLYYVVSECYHTNKAVQKPGVYGVSLYYSVTSEVS